MTPLRGGTVTRRFQQARGRWSSCRGGTSGSRRADLRRQLPASARATRSTFQPITPAYVSRGRVAHGVRVEVGDDGRARLAGDRLDQVVVELGLGEDGPDPLVLDERRRGPRSGRRSGPGPARPRSCRRSSGRTRPRSRGRRRGTRSPSGSPPGWRRASCRGIRVEVARAPSRRRRRPPGSPRRGRGRRPRATRAIRSAYIAA